MRGEMVFDFGPASSCSGFSAIGLGKEGIAHLCCLQSTMPRRYGRLLADEQQEDYAAIDPRRVVQFVHEHGHKAGS